MLRLLSLPRFKCRSTNAKSLRILNLVEPTSWHSCSYALDTPATPRRTEFVCGCVWLWVVLGHQDPWVFKCPTANLSCILLIPGHAPPKPRTKRHALSGVLLGLSMLGPKRLVEGLGEERASFRGAKDLGFGIGSASAHGGSICSRQRVPWDRLGTTPASNVISCGWRICSAQSLLSAESLH